MNTEIKESDEIVVNGVALHRRSLKILANWQDNNNESIRMRQAELMEAVAAITKNFDGKEIDKNTTALMASLCHFSDELGQLTVP